MINIDFFRKYVTNVFFCQQTNVVFMIGKFTNTQWDDNLMQQFHLKIIFQYRITVFELNINFIYFSSLTQIHFTSAKYL